MQGTVRGTPETGQPGQTGAVAHQQEDKGVAGDSTDGRGLPVFGDQEAAATKHS